MHNTGCVGYMDFDYIYFNTVADMAAVDAITEGGDKPTVTLAPSYTDYNSSVWASDVITSGASLNDANGTSYTNVYARIESEGDDKFVTFVDDNRNTEQAQLRFANTNDLTDKDTLTFKVDLRLRDNPLGVNSYNSSDNAVQIRVRNASSSGTANTGLLRVYAKDGKMYIHDYHGSAVATDIDVGEWCTITVSYTSNAAVCKVTVTSGDKTYTTDLKATSATHQVEISAISNFGIYTSTGFGGIFDVNNISISASKSAE